jgi:hypothetical protein
LPGTRRLYIAAEDGDEVSVQFYETERNGALPYPKLTRRYEAAFLRLCGILSRNRFTLTLFMSPRSLVLFVRAEEIGIDRAADLLGSYNDASAS